MPDSVTSRNRAATAGPRKNAAGPPLKTKAEKKAEARAAKARAQAMRRRRQTMSVVGSAVVVLALIVGLVVWIARTSPSAPAAAAPTDTPTAPASATTPAFPPLPAGADPALGTKPVVTKGTGNLTKLTTTTLIEGKGPAVQAGQTIDVNYVGVTYADGKEFDSSWKGSQALSFQVGGGNVIKGWDQGLIGVKVGSRVRLDIPAALAYGVHPPAGDPAGALRFVVDVLSAS